MSSSMVETLFPERFHGATEHPRKTIRDAIHSRLSNPVNPLAQPSEQKYWTPAGPNVFKRKELEIKFEDMPLILLRYQGEKILERHGSGWEGYDKRQIDLGIEIYVTVDPSQSAEDALDRMAFFVEACMNGFNIQRYSTEALLASTEYETEFDSAQPVAVGQLAFEITYLCPRLGVDFGLWDRDDACISNTGPNPPIQSVVVRNNFGTETFDDPWSYLNQ